MVDAEQPARVFVRFAKASVGDIPSRLKTKDMQRFRSKYNIPSDVVLFEPSLMDRTDTAVAGHFSFYEKFLEIGVRLSLHPFIRSVLSFYKIAPGQLMPNSWSKTPSPPLHLLGPILLQNCPRATHAQLLEYLLILLVLSQISDPPFFLDLAIFLQLFYLKDAGDLGRFSFYLRGKSGFLVTGLPTSEKSWKNKFFFASEARAQSSSDQIQIAWSKPGSS